MFKKIRTGFFLILGVMVLAACSTQKQTTGKQLTTDQIRVVSSLDFYAEMAQQILGDQGKVVSIINSSGIDPHDYTPTTADAKTVANADVAIMNGAGYDAWLQKLVTSNDRKVSTVDIAADVRHLPEGENEHLWYDFATMIKLNQALVKRFSTLRPKERQLFEKNGRKNMRQFQQLQQQVQQLKASFSEKQVMITEPVFNDVLSALDVKVVNPDFAQDIEEGADPKPAELQTMLSQLKQRKVAFLVVNRQVESPLIDELIQTAKKAGVPIVTVTETMPPHRTYLTWMTEQLAQLTKIAKGA